METLFQINSIGHTQADQILQAFVGIFETVFRNRIRGYYIEGSYADQTALPTSDIDLVILFKDSFIDRSERKQAEIIGEYFASAVQLELDIELLDEQEIANGVPPSLKIGSSVVYGEPIAEDLPLISVEDWGRERMHAAYWLIIKVFCRPIPVNHPLGFPNPKANFYGYTERIIKLPDGREVNSTRDLIRVIGWAGTALLALKSKQIVSRKKECHLLHRRFINDEWSSLLESIYRKCREEWEYTIPVEQRDQEELSMLCQ